MGWYVFMPTKIHKKTNLTPARKRFVLGWVSDLFPTKGMVLSKSRKDVGH